jgi:octaprenyl-diphosphate synthase
MGLGSKIQLAALLSNIRGLKEVEAIVTEKFVSEVPLLSEIPTYTFGLGGKRIRPVLTLVIGKLLGMQVPRQDLLEISAGIELIHLATLLHDDIIDKSPVRRHKESAYARFGIESTLLSGDFLLVRAFALCARLHPEIIAATEKACVELVEGEILETPLHTAKHSQESSLTIARKKTAALFRLSAFSGVFTVTNDFTLAKEFGRFGEELGTAFQILDDILDITSSEDVLGKRPGMDLVERKPSLVNVLWLESGEAFAQQLLLPPRGFDAEDEFRLAGVAHLKDSRIIEQARAMATSRVELAKKSLTAGLSKLRNPDDEALKLLSGLLQYTIERVN